MAVSEVNGKEIKLVGEEFIPGINETFIDHQILEESDVIDSETLENENFNDHQILSNEDIDDQIAKERKIILDVQKKVDEIHKKMDQTDSTDDEEYLNVNTADDEEYLNIITADKENQQDINDFINTDNVINKIEKIQTKMEKLLSLNDDEFKEELDKIKKDASESINDHIKEKMELNKSIDSDEKVNILNGKYDLFIELIRKIFSKKDVQDFITILMLSIINIINANLHELKTGEFIPPRNVFDDGIGTSEFSIKYKLKIIIGLINEIINSKSLSKQKVKD